MINLFLWNITVTQNFIDYILWLHQKICFFILCMFLIIFFISFSLPLKSPFSWHLPPKSPFSWHLPPKTPWFGILLILTHFFICFGILLYPKLFRNNFRQSILLKNQLFLKRIKWKRYIFSNLRSLTNFIFISIINGST